MKLQDVIDQNLAIDLNKAPSSLLEEIQIQLERLKLYPKQEIDGEYGPLTKAGWEAFKKQHKQGNLDLIGAGSAKLLLEATKTVAKVNPSGLLADRIYQVCQARGYTLDQREGAVNLFGIEGMTVEGKKIPDVADGWNDVIGILTFKGGQPIIQCIYQGTTEPGKYYTLNPLNKGGAARLQLGQQKGIWGFGLHRGYEALVQLGPARLVRDKKRNYSRNQTETVEWGNGVNLHTTKTTGWRGAAGAFVGQWSAGCVVVKDPKQFLSLIAQVKASLQYKENKRHKFDFTLLWQDWL